jgi:hypothetical protein
MENAGVSPRDLAVEARLVSVPEPQEDADAAYPWDERVPPPGKDATLLAVVPIPGTGTSLAIVGYAIATSDDQRAGQPLLVPAPTRPVQSQPVQSQPARHRPGRHSSGRYQAGQKPPDRTRSRRKHGTGLRLDHVQRRVWADGHEITLAYQEFELLAFLSAHPSTVFTRADLVQQVWHRPGAGQDAQGSPCGPEAAGDSQAGGDARPVTSDSRTVDVHISRLRHKLGPRYGQCLVTEYRVGYQFRPAAP